MDEQGRTVLRRFLAGLLLVAMIFVVIWFIFLRDSGKKEVGDQGANTGKSQTASNERGDSGNRAQARSNEDKQSTAGNTTGTDTKKPTNTGQLTNVGPGNSLALFISSSIAAGTGHYLYRRRRHLRNS